MPANLAEHVRSSVVPILRSIALGVLATVLVTTTSGCFTGERPSFADSTDDAAIDAVLSHFDAAGTTMFTASYTIQTRSSATTTDAAVAVAPPAERSVTIGDVRFLTTGDAAQTCDLALGQCVANLEPQRVSNVQVGPDFYAASAVAQLRADAAAATQPGIATTETIAGQPATCVGVTLTGGMKTYCVLDSGALARMDAGGTAVLIELKSYSPTVDQALFATTR